MNIISRLVIVVVFMFLEGCAISHDYEWKEYPITSDRITTQSGFPAGKEIKIINGKSSDTMKELGRVGVHKFIGTNQMLTDGIAKQLATEMEKMQLVIKNTAEKRIEITVNDTSFTQAAWFGGRAKCELTLKFENGKNKSYSVENRSPSSAGRAFNGLVARVVIQIMNDKDVLDYINE